MSTLTRIGLGIGAIAVTVGLVAGVYVSAQNADGPRRPFAERRGGPGGPMGALGPMLAGHLNLTDAQKDQLKGIMRFAPRRIEGARRPRDEGAPGAASRRHSRHG